MLHLFFIHSFATYHCARGVMATEGLARESCLFVLTRSFKCPERDEKVPCANLDSYGEPNLNCLRRVISGKRNLRQRDKQISDLTGGREFICYTPHVYFDFIELHVTHPLCAGFAYLEEGLTSYYRTGEIDQPYPPWTFSLRTRLLRTLVFGKRLQKQVHFFRSGYQKAYGFSPDSFPGWERTVTLGIARLLPSLRDGARPPYPPIIVFDALVELKKTSSDVLGKAIIQLLNRLRTQGIREIHYKFHPSQLPETSTAALCGIFENYRPELELRELPREISLEDLFSKKQMTVYVFNSASGLYASLAGQEVFTLNPLVGKLDPPYGQTIRDLPDIYHQLVKPLVEESACPSLL